VSQRIGGWASVDPVAPAAPVLAAAPVVPVAALLPVSPAGVVDSVAPVAAAGASGVVLSAEPPLCGAGAGAAFGVAARPSHPTITARPHAATTPSLSIDNLLHWPHRIGRPPAPP